MKHKKKTGKTIWQKERPKEPAGQKPKPQPTGSSSPAATHALTAPEPLGSTQALAVAGAILIVGAIWAYWPNLQEMFSLWANQPDYSHGYLVLPLAILLLWLRRDTYPANDVHPALVAGLSVVGLAVIIRLASAKFFYGPIDTWSLMIWVAGTVLALWGWKVLWWALPSILFLWFAMPLPWRVEMMLRQPLQRLATNLSAMVLVVLGEPAIAEANVIRISDRVFGVDEACSGLRIFLGIAAFAFALAVLWRTSWIKRLLLILAILPVAIFANVTRIVVTCLLHEWVGSEAAQRFSHDAAGFVMIPYAAILLCLVLWLLNKIVEEVEVFESTSVFRGGSETAG